MAKALMIQGTCSGAGKSLVTAALCRILKDKGIRVAPFKSQNMALNSFITMEGAEIGRAQALQAEAARLLPHSDMNPVLLKTAGPGKCQVILGGKVHSVMSAREYYSFRDTAWQHVEAAYARLSAAYDAIVIEGAGSPAEINLMEEEIVNMRVARHAKCPVLLVGDIDRGGVFASFYGTVGLLPEDAHLIKGFLINKFRGDVEILRPGLTMIKERTGVPVLGVLPYMHGLGLEEEDGLGLTGHAPSATGQRLRIVVLRLPSISNFTDLSPFLYEPDCELTYSLNPSEILNADLLIIPGSKNTVPDLLALRKMGLDQTIREAASRGVEVVGLCGGYQMLGANLLDPLGVESAHPEVAGLGLLDITTEFEPVKVTCQSEADTHHLGGHTGLRGYEIHMGRTTGDVGLFSFHRLPEGRSGKPLPEGSLKGRVWGTYLHGLFDNDSLRHTLLNNLRAKRAMPQINTPVEFARIKEERMARWAEAVRTHIDMERIEALLC